MITVFLKKKELLGFIMFLVFLNNGVGLRAQVTEFYVGLKVKTEILKEQRISVQIKEEIRFRKSEDYYRST